MAFLPLVGSLIGPLVGSLIGHASATGAGLSAGESAFLDAENVDQILELNTQHNLSKKSQAFNDNMVSDTEMAKESNLLQNFYVSVAQADKSVIEKLSQSVSQS